MSPWGWQEAKALALLLQPLFKERKRRSSRLLSRQPKDFMGEKYILTVGGFPPVFELSQSRKQRKNT